MEYQINYLMKRIVQKNENLKILKFFHYHILNRLQKHPQTKDHTVDNRFSFLEHKASKQNSWKIQKQLWAKRAITEAHIKVWLELPVFSFSLVYKLSATAQVNSAKKIMKPACSNIPMLSLSPSLSLCASLSWVVVLVVVGGVVAKHLVACENKSQS